MDNPEKHDKSDSINRSEYLGNIMNTHHGERHGARRVVIVDDDCAVRLSLRQIFARDDRFAVVSEHARAKDAIHKLTDMPTDQLPDLVLLDITMPGMDGIECCHELRTYFPKLVIAMFTARRLPCFPQAARRAGADAYFCKTMEPRSLSIELAGLQRTECMLFGPGVLLGGETGDTTMMHDPRLSPRQEQVLEMRARQLTVKEIAGHFHVAQKTIYTQQCAAMTRIDAAKRPER